MRVTLPAGQDRVTLPIRPLDDDLKEGQETVWLRALPSFGYSLGDPNAQMIVIEDND